MKAPLILVVSDRMDSNKKQDRNENSLIRMGSKARERLGLANEKTVEIWPDTNDSDRIHRSRGLEIFHAYSDEIKKAKESMPEEDFLRVGFVTTNTFNYICKDGRKKKQSIWIADTIEDTIIGGDPEFVLMEDGGLIKYASEVEGFSHNDTLGSDGPLAELRPEPAVSVDAFIDNIHNILCDHPNAELIDPYRWIGGCFFNCGRSGVSDSERGWPVGGHIHIGTPARLAHAIEASRDKRDDNYHISVYACLQKILDEYVAIPMMRLDGKERGIARRQTYGSFGDYKTNHGRLEYRTISGEWLTHPDLARIVVGVVKAVSHAYFKILEERDFEHDLVMTNRQVESNRYGDFRFFQPDFCYWKNIEIMKAFDALKNSSMMALRLNEWKMEFTVAYFNRLKARYRKLSTYREYAEYIDKFVEMVRMPKDVLENREKELKHTWVGGSGFII